MVAASPRSSRSGRPRPDLASWMSARAWLGGWGRSMEAMGRPAASTRKAQGAGPVCARVAHRLRRLERKVRGPDTSVSAAMMEKSLDAVVDKVRIDRHHDVPYLAGYSLDGKTIYIDRDLPATYRAGGRDVAVRRFLVLHEVLEKTLMDGLGLLYQHAHQIATRAEQAAVRAAGGRWTEYDRFMQKHIGKARTKALERIPVDLDLRPYRDEQDAEMLARMAAAQRKDAKRRGT